MNALANGTSNSGNTALAIRDDQTGFTPEQLAALREIVKLEHVPPAMQSVFLHQCKRTGLDPFLRQIYLIGRWDGTEGRDKYTIQTGIDGFRLIRDRIERQRGLSVSYEDTVWRATGPDAQWTDFWDSDEPPVAAKVVIVVDDGTRQRRYSAVAHYREYVAFKGRGGGGAAGEPNSMWKKMPAGQLGKCAEALTLRKAFPVDLGGLYTEEEMGQADAAAAAEAQVTAVRAAAERRNGGGPPPAAAATESAPATPPVGGGEDIVEADIVEDDPAPPVTAAPAGTAAGAADDTARVDELRQLGTLGNTGQQAVLSRLAGVAVNAGWTAAEVARVANDRYGKPLDQLDMNQLSTLYADARRIAGRGEPLV